MSRIGRPARYPGILTAKGKICTGCGEDKPLSEFRRQSDQGTGFSPRCKACLCAYAREYYLRNADKAKAYRERNRERIRESSRRSNERRNRLGRRHEGLRKFGLTLADYEALLAAQGNRCAICGRTDPGSAVKDWAVDHCHETGKVRGILCHPCNKGIGHLGDDPDRMLAAAAYLLRHTNLLEAAL